ncbi:MAG: twin-arginine translocation signal domain-containing protein [Woeseiaceae bacterium]|nr:twin-arginine translocation signal domain-containing protein [Woeseiaceae bacterium]
MIDRRRFLGGVSAAAGLAAEGPAIRTAFVTETAAATCASTRSSPMSMWSNESSNT